MNDNFRRCRFVLFFLTFSADTSLFAAERETDCKDGIDNDNDTVYDFVMQIVFLSRIASRARAKKKVKQLAVIGLIMMAMASKIVKIWTVTRLASQRVMALGICVKRKSGDQSRNHQKYIFGLT